MKTCSRCNQPKSVDEFNKKGEKYQPYCKPCSREYGREHYAKDRETNAAKSNLKRKKRMDGIRTDIRKLKESTPCLDCNQFYPWYVYDYDHVNGKKTTHISEMIRNGAARWRIFSEITKCELVCANCHRERTFRRAGLSKESAEI